MVSLSRHIYNIYKEKNLQDDNFVYKNNTIESSLITKTLDLFAVEKVCIKSDKNFYSFYVEYNIEKDILELTFGSSNQICIDGSDYKNRCAYLINTTLVSILVFGDNNTIYLKHYSQKKGDYIYIPFTVQKYLSISENPYAFKVFDYIFNYYSSITLFIKDIQRTIKKDGFFLIPLTFNEILKYHNAKEMFLDKYKLCSCLDINWNKRDMNISYLIIKCWNMVKVDCRGKLIQCTQLPEHFTYSYYSKKNCENFIVSYLCQETKSDVKDFISDYYKMCRLTKEKINLKFSSEKAIIEEHDRLSERAYMKHTPLVKIKKDSRFKNLRKILPEEFEWIKSRKRLIKETVMQHHCVWSYADSINKDKCQIYSFVDKTGMRFTLEFCIRKNNYYLNQVQGKYNQGDTLPVIEYVKEIFERTDKNETRNS